MTLTFVRIQVHALWVESNTQFEYTSHCIKSFIIMNHFNNDDILQGKDENTNAQSMWRNVYKNHTCRLGLPVCIKLGHVGQLTKT